MNETTPTLSAGGRPVGGWRCTACAGVLPRWLSKCSECSARNTLVFVAGRDQDTYFAASTGEMSETGELAEATTDAFCVDDAPGQDAAIERVPSGLQGWDHVTSGVVGGTTTLLTGPFGGGKSTLAMELCAGSATSERPTLYASAEENRQLLEDHARRARVTSRACHFVATVDLDAALHEVRAIRPALFVVDSLQKFVDSSVGALAATPTQVRTIAARLIALAREERIAVIIIAQSTKGGSFAGPNIVAHDVDVCLRLARLKGGRRRLSLRGRQEQARHRGESSHLHDGREDWLPDGHDVDHDGDAAPGAADRDEAIPTEG